ncbi:hypothetical protein D3C78_1619900 [compost metagenome]
MTRGEIALQLLEQRPAIDVRQARVQRDRGGFEAFDKLQRIRATGRDDSPEARLVRGFEQNAGESGVALEHQQHLVPGLDRLAVVGYLCRRAWHEVALDLVRYGLCR